MMSRILAALAIVAFFSSFVLAQQSACKAADIPVGVIGSNGETFRGLAAEDFIGHVQKKPVAVKDVAFGDGPRRILIVGELNRKISADSRKAEDEMIKTLLASARPKDTFAIMPAHGPSQDVKFTEDRTAIRQALEQPGDGKRGKDPGVLDTVMVGIEWFGAPQPGDSIVVIAADMQGSHKTNARWWRKLFTTTTFGCSAWHWDRCRRKAVLPADSPRQPVHKDWHSQSRWWESWFTKRGTKTSFR